MIITIKYNRKNFFGEFEEVEEHARFGDLEDALKAFRYVSNNYDTAVDIGEYTLFAETEEELENGIITSVNCITGAGVETKKMSAAKAKRFIKELFAEEEKENGAAE